MTNELKLSQTISANGARPKKRKIASLDRRKARAGWIFVLPFIIGFAVVYIPMLFDSIKLSFCELEKGVTPVWVGWENYEYALFTNPNFVQTLISGLKQLIFDIPAILIFSLFMAVLLNQKMIGRAAFRAILFVPVILCTGLVDKMDAENAMMNSMGTDQGIDTGMAEDAVEDGSRLISMMDVATLFEGMKVGTGLVKYVTELVNGVYDIINQSGVQMLIFLAGLQSISPAIYESCSIDGATTWETFWKITFPMISPMILVNTIYTVIDSFTSSRNTVMSYINEIYAGSNGWVTSAAMSWIYFIIVIGIIALVAGVLSSYIFYQKRD